MVSGRAAESRSRKHDLRDEAEESTLLDHLRETGCGGIYYEKHHTKASSMNNVVRVKAILLSIMHPRSMSRYIQPLLSRLEAITCDCPLNQLQGKQVSVSLNGERSVVVISSCRVNPDPANAHQPQIVRQHTRFRDLRHHHDWKRKTPDPQISPQESAFGKN